MSKLSNFKKGLIYALATLLVIPTWFAMDMSEAERVSAAVGVSSEIIDDSSAAGFSLTGSNWVTGYPGQGYLNQVGYVNKDSIDGLSTATWKPVNLKAGNARVYFHWTTNTNRAKNAKYTVTNKYGVPVTETVNQELLADEVTVGADGQDSGWLYAGTYEMDASGVASVTLSNSGADEYVIADAVKFEIDQYPSASTFSEPLSLVNKERYDADGGVEVSWSASVDPDGDTTGYEVNLFDSDPKLSGVAPIGSYVGYNTTNTFPGLSDGQYWLVINVFSSDMYAKVIYHQTTDLASFILDTDLPTLTLSGDNPLVLERGTSYVDGGNFEATDKVAGDLDSEVVVDTSTLDTNVVGSYQVTYNVSDAAGNPAVEEVRVVNVVDTQGPITPVITVSKDDKTIKMNFDGVGGGVEYYEVYVNGVLNEKIVVSGDDYGYEYKREITVLEYGDYEVHVVAYESGNSGKSNVENVSLASSEPVATVTPAVVTTTSVVTPEAASAADDNVADDDEEDVEEDGVEALDEDGKIKGEEDEKAAEEESDINWTPWIILFILIILAGAATGGYFYWFADEEEIETKVRESKKPAKSSAPKKSNKSKGSSKRRW